MFSRKWDFPDDEDYFPDYFESKGDNNMIKKYRKKPVEIEAMQWLGKESMETFKEFTQLRVKQPNDPFGCGHVVLLDEKLVFTTLMYRKEANPGDYIIKDEKGECYPCKADTFEATYEEV